MNVGGDVVAKSNNMDARVDKKVVLSLRSTKVGETWRSSVDKTLRSSARYGGAQSINSPLVAAKIDCWINKAKKRKDAWILGLKR